MLTRATRRTSLGIQSINGSYRAIDRDARLHARVATHHRHRLLGYVLPTQNEGSCMTRKQEVEKLSLTEAIEYFEHRGVGVRGVRTQSQLNEALNDHRHAFPLKPRLSDEIEGYLLTHGYKRGDIKATHRDKIESHRLRSGRRKATRWLVFKSKIQNWWWQRRH